MSTKIQLKKAETESRNRKEKEILERKKQEISAIIFACFFPKWSTNISFVNKKKATTVRAKIKTG